MGGEMEVMGEEELGQPESWLVVVSTVLRPIEP